MGLVPMEGNRFHLSAEEVVKACGAAPPGRPSSGRSWPGGLRILRRPFALVLGLKLYLITTPDGMPVVWCLASPGVRERGVAADLLARIAQRLLAMAATIWHNWATAESAKRSLIAYDH
jgi:hypothetical protein